MAHDPWLIKLANKIAFLYLLIGETENDSLNYRTIRERRSRRDSCLVIYLFRTLINTIMEVPIGRGMGECEVEFVGPENI